MMENFAYIEEPTMRLRFVERIKSTSSGRHGDAHDGQVRIKVLQQAFLLRGGDKQRVEWRDVPLEDEY